MPNVCSVGFLCVSHPHCAGRLSAARALPSAEVAAVYDPDTALALNIAEAQDARPCRKPGELLQDPSIGLVVIEGTNRQNSEMAIACAQAGKPMLIEKPGAENLGRVREVAEAVRRAGVFCQVGYHLRYSPSIRAAREMLPLLGRVTTARFHSSVMAPWLTNGWFCDPDDMGGLVFLDFCHMLDLLSLFLGLPAGYHSKLVKLDGAAPHPFEDSAAFLLEYGDVLAAGDCCGWEANDWITTWDIELYGTSGTLKVGVHPPWWRLYLKDAEPPHEAGWSAWMEPSYDGEENYRLELADILGSIQAGRAPGGCDIEHAVKLLEVIDRMYKQNGL